MTADEPLWIVGASVRAAAQSARRAGIEVRAADLFADLDTRRAAETGRIVDYPQGIQPLLAAAPPGPWMYTGALENYPELIASVSATRPLWGNDAEAVRRVRDPWLVRDTLLGAGLSCPRLRHLDEPAPAEGARWLRKPRRSAAGHGVAFQGGLAQPRDPAELYLQEFIPGTPCALTFVAAAGQARLWMISEQLIGAAWTGGKDFWYCGSMGPMEVGAVVGEADPPYPPLVRGGGVGSEGGVDLVAEAERIGGCLAAEFGLVGVFGVDCILSAGPHPTWFPIEVNPRYTASVELWERVSGHSAIAAQREACIAGQLQGPPHRSLLRGAMAGKAIVYARRDVTLDAPRIEALAAGANLGPECQVADIPYLSEDSPTGEIAFPAGSPIVTLLVEGTSRDGVLRSLQNSVRTFESWLYA